VVIIGKAQIGKAHFHDSEKVKFFEERAERAVAFISKYVLPMLAIVGIIQDC